MFFVTVIYYKSSTKEKCPFICFCLEYWTIFRSYIEIVFDGQGVKEA